VMQRSPKNAAPAEVDPVRGSVPGTVTGSVVVEVGTVSPCSRNVVVVSGWVVVVVRMVVEPWTSVVDVVVLPCSLIVVVVSSGTVVEVVVSGTVVEVVVSGTVVEVVVSGTVVEVEVDEVEVEVDVVSGTVDVVVELDEDVGAVVEVVVVSEPPTQNVTWLIAGASSPPLSGGCSALPLVTAGS
jgi:hypothetical protein